MQYSRVKAFFDDIEKRGWKVVTDGRIMPSAGYMVTPTIIDRPPDNSRIVVEEPFGEWVFEDLLIRSFTYFHRPDCTAYVVG